VSAGVPTVGRDGAIGAVGVPSVGTRRWRSEAFWHRAIRAVSLVVLLLALGLALARGQGAAVPVALVGAALGGLLVFRVYRGADRELLLTLFFAALALRLLVAVVVHPYLLHRLVTGSRDVTTVGVMFEDDRVFDVVAWALARAWAGVIEGVDRNDGYLINNFTYATAWLYYLLGHELMAAKFLNCVLGALVPVATFSLGKELGGGRVARFAAVAAAVFPSLVLWSTLNLKDVMIVLLLTATMLATIRFARAPTVFAAVLALVPFFLIESLRVYVFYLLGWLMPLTFFVLHRVPWRRRLVIGAPFAIAVLSVVYLTNETQALGLRYLTDKRLEALDSSRAFGANAAESGIDIEKVPRSEGGTQIQLVNAPRVLPYVLFAPFPWQARRPRDLAAVPEVLAWYGIMALAVVALVAYGRRRWRELFLPVLYGAGMVAIFSIIEGNVGTIFRHRSMLMPPAFVLAGLGLVWLDGWRARRRGQEPTPEPAGAVA
jgi:hypothetical protein